MENPQQTAWKYDRHYRYLQITTVFPYAIHPTPTVGLLNVATVGTGSMERSRQCHWLAKDLKQS